MDDGAGTTTTAIGRREALSLRLVFGGPVSLWVPMARLAGVRVDPEVTVDDALLAEAEAGAGLAARRFGPGLVATTASVIGFVVWTPMQTRMIEPFVDSGFHTIAEGIMDGGGSFLAAVGVASVTLFVVFVLLGLLNAAVFCGVPFVLLRRCTVAAAPAVSIAMAQGDEAVDGRHAAAYPRVAFAAERILYPRGRERG